MSGINLIGLTRSELRNFAESIDEKSYRGDQIFSWIYQYNETKFSQMTNLSKEFRSNIEKSALNELVVTDTIELNEEAKKCKKVRFCKRGGGVLPVSEKNNKKTETYVFKLLFHLCAFNKF